MGHHGLVDAFEFVTRQNSVQLTIRPVQDVFEHSQRVGVQQVLHNKTNIYSIYVQVLVKSKLYYKARAKNDIQLKCSIVSR